MANYLLKHYPTDSATWSMLQISIMFAGIFFGALVYGKDRKNG